MDNARKKYVNIQRSFGGEVFVLHDSIESDDERDIENIINDSDTKFVVEDESVISTNIITKEEISDQSSYVSVSEASIHILATQNEDETDTLDQDELNSVPATQRTFNQSPPTTQRTSNQSPSPANQCTANQLPAAATQRTSIQSTASSTQRTANQSPAAVVTNSNQSSKSTPPSTVILPKNTKKLKQNSMTKDKTKKKKVNDTFDENNTNHKEGSVPQDKDKTKKKKTIRLRNGNRRIKKSL